MAFPSSPIDGQLYTNALGTQYSYVLADTAWKIVGGGGGVQGATGIQGYTGIQGLVGETGIQGPGTVSGTQNYLAKFTASDTVGDSIIPVVGDEECLLSTNSYPDTTAYNLFIGGGGQSVNNSSALRNTSVGISSLLSTEGASENVAVGYGTLMWQTEGGYNVVVGSKSGQTDVGSNALTGPNGCVYIGYNIKSLTTTPTNEICIGESVEGKGTNTTVIGNQYCTKATINGNLGIDNYSPLGIFHPISDGSTAAYNICGNVGPTTALSGTFTRDSTSWTTMCREDTGTLTDGGVLRIVGHDSTGLENFTGFGFLWSTGEDTLNVRSSNFTFAESVTLANTIGDVQNGDVTGALCIYASGNTVSETSYLDIKNNAGSTVRMGYWVKYWYWPE